MKRAFRIKSAAFLILCAGFLQWAIKGYAHSVGNQEMGLSFIENKGQWDSGVKYKVEIPNGAFFLTDGGFVYNFESAVDRKRIEDLTCGRIQNGLKPADISQEVVHYHAYKINFVGAQQPDAYAHSGKRSWYHNYFQGNDPSKWAGGVGLYRQVLQQGIYKGIDLTMYSYDTSLKYDFVVAPGADPDQIVLGFDGVQPVITADGHLRITTSVNEVIERAPYVYQIIDGKEVSVRSRYRLQKGLLRFELLEQYNKAFPLVIDPELVFSTYSGSTGGGHLSYATTYDKSGNLYPGASAGSPGWPTTTGAFQRAGGGGSDVGINKYNANGSALIFSTYYGGGGADVVHAMVTNEKDELIIVGSTNSYDLPFTKGCYDSTFNGGTDIFIARFNSFGTALLGATFMGTQGMDPMPGYTIGITMSPLEATLDAEGNIWVAASTSSNAFPVTSNAFRGAFGGGMSDGVLFQLSPDCIRLMYSSYVGGAGVDLCYNVVINRSGNVVVCGATTSNNFPTTSGAMRTSAIGGEDGFVCIIDPKTGNLLHSTYVGTLNFDHAYRLQVDKQDNVFVLGRTTGEYPISPGVYSIPGSDIFIDKLKADLSASIVSTRIGNPQQGSAIYPAAFLYDICGNVYVSAFNTAANLPLTPDAYQTTNGGFWFCVFNPNFESLKYASYFGDQSHSHEGTHRFDPLGVVYQTVCSSSDRFPITDHSVFPKKQNTSVDNLSFKYDFESSISFSRFELGNGQNDSGCAPYTLQFVNTSVLADQSIWDFGDGSPLSTETSPQHTYTKAGTYRVALYVHSDNSCNINDTSYRTIEVLYVETPDITVRDTLFCHAIANTDISVQVNNRSQFTRIQWGPPEGILSDPTKDTINVDPNVNLVYYVTVKDTVEGVCGFSTVDTVLIDLSPRVLRLLNGDSTVCQGTEVQIRTQGTPGYRYQWTPALGVSDTTIAEPVIMINQPNVYTLTASYHGCEDTTVQIIYNMEKYPVVEIGPDRTVCEGDEVPLEAHIVPFNSAYTYEWLPKANLEFSDGPNARFIADSSGVYSLLVRTPIGCTGGDSLRIRVIPGNFGTAIADTAYCLPNSVQLWADGGTRYLWQPGYGLNDSTLANPQASPQTPTDYRVYIWDEYGCLDSQQVMVDVWPGATIELADSVNIYPGEQYQLLPATNCTYFEWFPNSGISNVLVSNPFVYPEVRTRYYVTARTEQGCQLRDSIDILVNCTAIDIPNVFAPQSTAGNHLFKASRRGIATLNSFTIYNRWGNKVFETQDIDEGWDGTFKGKIQPLGVYIYKIDATTECGTLFYKEGNVTLLR